MDGQIDPGWVRSGWGHRVGTLEETFRAVTRVVTTAADRRYVWRGCSDASRRVRPALLDALVVDEAEPLPTERQVRQNELALLREARAWGLPAGAGPTSDLALLAHLHEHGLPTRLLDVTRDPMTALWSACAGDDDRPGVLLVVDTTAVPTIGTADPEPWRDGPDPLAWTLRAALRRSAVDAAPFLVRPTTPSARQQAQQTLLLGGAVPAEPLRGGVDGLPLPRGRPPGRAALAALFGEAARQAGRPTRLPFCALLVPARLKPAVRAHLTALDRRREVLFPDVEGFRDAVRAEQVTLHPLPDVVPAEEDTEAGGAQRSR